MNAKFALTSPALSVPPLRTVSVPLPELPTRNMKDELTVEPGPSMTMSPVLPVLTPIYRLSALTTPPAVTFREPVPLAPTRMRPVLPVSVLSRIVPAPLTDTVALEPAASAMRAFSVVLRRPPFRLRATIWPAAVPISRLSAAVFAWVRVRTPPVTFVVPSVSCRALSEPPAASINVPADDLTRLLAPPVIAPPKVKLPVPEPVMVVVAATVAAGERTTLPAPPTAIDGLVPAHVSGLPASVTVQEALLTVRPLSWNGLAMSFVAV